jgi:hypothetical protein
MALEEENTSSAVCGTFNSKPRPALITPRDLYLYLYPFLPISLPSSPPSLHEVSTRVIH